MREYKIDNLDDLLLLSNNNPEQYWGWVSEYLKLDWYQPYRQVFDSHTHQWYVGGKINSVQNALDRHTRLSPGLCNSDEQSPSNTSKLALIYENAEKGTHQYTYRELSELTSRTAYALTTLGIQAGDSVALLLPLLPETVAILLACSKIGAVCVPIPPYKEYQAVAEVLNRTNAKVLVTTDGYFVDRVFVPTKSIADRASVSALALETIITIRHAYLGVSWLDGRDLWWHDVMPHHSTEHPTYHADPNHPLILEMALFDNLMPLCHSHIGLSVKAAHDLAFTFDVHQDDVILWYTHPERLWDAWAIVGALTLGATLLIYEGSLDLAETSLLRSLLERHNVSVLCVDPVLVRPQSQNKDEVKRDPSILRIIGSTGEPWTVEQWQWMFEYIGRRLVPIVNYYREPELGGGILGCTTLKAIKAGAFNGPIPGVDIDFLNVIEDQPGAIERAIIRPSHPGSNSCISSPIRFESFSTSKLASRSIFIDPDGYWFLIDS